MKSNSAFTLIELLMVLSVIIVMVALTVPLVRHLGADDMDSVQSNVQNILEQSREYARANRTYVRVGFVQGTSSSGLPQVIAQALESTTGDLSNDTLTGLANNTDWESVGKPVIMVGATFDNSLLSKIPTGSGTATISVLSGTNFTSFSRPCGGQSYTYTQIVQFDPQGQVSLAPPDVPTRTAMIGFSNSHQAANPVVVLMSGLTGNIQVLRAENLNP